MLLWPLSHSSEVVCEHFEMETDYTHAFIYSPPIEVQALSYHISILLFALLRGRTSSQLAGDQKSANLMLFAPSSNNSEPRACAYVCPTFFFFFFSLTLPNHQNLSKKKRTSRVSKQQHPEEKVTFVVFTSRRNDRRRRRLARLNASFSHLVFPFFSLPYALFFVRGESIDQLIDSLRFHKSR